MSWLSVLGFGKGLLKSKWFWAAIIVCVIAFYVSRYTGLIQDVERAYAQVSSLSKSLETTNESIDLLRSEMQRIDEYTLERQQSREDIRKELENTRKELERAREKNEELAQCWSVDHGDAFERLRPPATKD